MSVKQTKENTIEMYTRWYFEELIDEGYVEKVEREPETIICAEREKYGKVKYLKRRPNEMEEFNLFQDITYTYDFKVTWTNKGRFIFFDVVDETNEQGQTYLQVFRYGKPLFIANEVINKDGSKSFVTRVDTKPTSSVGQKGGKVSSSYSFPVKKRMIWDKHGIYITKFIPIPMGGTGKTIAKFCTSFVPKRYLFTDAEGSTRLRKAPKWERRTLSQFVRNQLESNLYWDNYNQSSKQNKLNI